MNVVRPDTPEETAEALDEAHAIADEHSARFSNVDDMFESLDI